MTDKKPNKSEASDKKNTEEKSEQGFSTSISLTSAPKASSNDEKKQSENNKASATVNEKKSTMKTPEKMSAPLPKDNTETHKQKFSKTAVLALIIALAASAGVGGLFYWGTQQQALTKQAISQQTQQSLANSEQQVKQLLKQQQATFSVQLTNNINRIEKDSQIKISQLEKVVERLSQNQPSDWLLHEAEYLIRIATRTMWLEHDTSAAIGLLQDADMRLKELQSPEFLPIRQLIREDIAMLKLIPDLDSEETIMTLMAMNQQLKHLPLAMVKIPESDSKSADFTLSENATDWRSNLAKTWDKFLADFITVRRRSGNVEPIMSPQYQQNLRENLSLKLQLVQWATAEQKQKIYDQTLTEIQQWFNDFFDMSRVENQNFYQDIQQLKSEIISYDYPNSLLSLKAIRKVLADKPLKPMIDKLELPNELLTPERETVEERLAIPKTLPDNNLSPNDGTSEVISEKTPEVENKIAPSSTDEAR
ncbi:MAG: uroporphyrinogen-III C-methyltransferase [Colwellia sp.]|nr:uroporphyrinogen-III C-methyltransferase [Colwellia sp.]